MSSRPAWPTWQVQDKPALHSETLSKKKKNKNKNKKFLTNALQLKFLMEMKWNFQCQILVGPD
jgi:hypothetical protein